MSDDPPAAMARCPRCHGALAGGLLANRCPRCLARALSDDTEEPLEPSPATAPAGRRIGDYELLEEVGRGGMGIVFRARQLSLDREVALKVLRDPSLASTAEVDRFRDEAVAAGRLSHPNLVRVHDIGDGGGIPYFAMEFITGRHLGDMTRNGPLPAREAAALLVKIADAIQHAHDRGLLHRDLKPSNVIVDGAGEPHVTDFGLAKRLPLPGDSVPGADLTLTGQILGTPAYAAPELAGGRRAETGPASDVYSLGALLYHLLTGRAPFTGESVADILRQVAEQEPLSPRLVTPSVPADLATLCLKCLAKRPSRRCASARELADELRRFLRGEPIHARPAGAPERAWRWCQRNPALAAALAFAGLALSGGLAGTSWQWRKAQIGVRERQRQLWNSQHLEARAFRKSGEPGQRLETLRVVAKARTHAASTALRSEAAAALALPDLVEQPGWIQAQSDVAEHFRPPNYSVCPANGRVAQWWRFGPDHRVIRIESADTNTPPVLLDHDGCAGDELLFSPDGRWLAAWYFRHSEVVVWNVDRAAVHSRISLERSAYFNFDFSPDGNHLAICAAHGVVRLLDLVTREELPPLVVPGDPHLFRARFCPRHSWIALALDNELRVVDWRTHEQVARETLPGDLTSALAWHPEGELIAATCWMRPEIHLCRILPARPEAEGVGSRGPQRRRVLYEHAGPVNLLAFSPDGTLLAARGTDGFTRLWNVAAGRVVLTTASGLVSTFSRDGARLYFDRVTAGAGCWELTGNGGIHRALRGGGPDGYLAGADFSADGRMLAWAQGGATGLYDIETGQLRGLGREGSSAVRFDARDGALLTAGEEGLQRWRNSQAVPLLPGIRLDALAQSHDARRIATAVETNLWIIDEATRQFTLPERVCGNSLAFSSDGRFLAAGTYADHGLIIDPDTGRTLREFEGRQASVAFDPLGRWLAVGTPQDYRLLSLRDWTVQARQPRVVAMDAFFPLAVAPDGAHIAVTLQPRVISILSTGKLEEVIRLESPTPMFISALRFSPDGRHLAVSSEGGVMQLWDLGRLRSELAKLRLDWVDAGAP